jgi:hypothetical protein
MPHFLSDRAVITDEAFFHLCSAMAIFIATDVTRSRLGHITGHLSMALSTIFREEREIFQSDTSRELIATATPFSGSTDLSDCIHCIRRFVRHQAASFSSRSRHLYTPSTEWATSTTGSNSVIFAAARKRVNVLSTCWDSAAPTIVVRLLGFCSTNHSGPRDGRRTRVPQQAAVSRRPKRRHPRTREVLEIHDWPPAVTSHMIKLIDAPTRRQSLETGVRREPNTPIEEHDCPLQRLSLGAAILNAACVWESRPSYTVDGACERRSSALEMSSDEGICHRSRRLLAPLWLRIRHRNDPKSIMFPQYLPFRAVRAGETIAK